MPASRKSDSVPRPPATWLVRGSWAALGLTAVFLAGGAWLNSGSVLYGICTLFAFAWVALSLTAVYVGATGRPSWMRLRGGRLSALPVAALGASAYILMGVLSALLTRA